MTKVAKVEKEVILDQVLCMHYLVQVRRDKKETIRALIDSSSKVNVMTLAYAKQLGLQVQKTDVGA